MGGRIYLHTGLHDPSPMAAKWEGRVTETLTVATPDQIWPMIKDFFNFHKWFPTLANCYGLSGTNAEVGSVRFCSGFSIPSSDGSDGVVSWSKERLVGVDEEHRRICYEIVDSNIGFKSYVATMEVGSVSGGGCMIEWRFEVEAVEGLKLEDLVKKYEVGLRSMANRMEAAVVENEITK
ncbi:lachrymatory-factor synthase [Cucumis sativus]|uniref:Bet v I/Major latex protein domain-containing protein n=1 Tax=Cucumis sativus TaxID=3659 RepID=A0A0A0LPR8_CUCSA|nr:lachrymatory-factor synthase [Cucumis sativus]